MPNIVKNDYRIVNTGCLRALAAFFRRPDVAQILLQLGVFSAIYYLYYTRAFLSGEIVVGGDTQLLWSLNYLALHTIANHGAFLWWDPTTINGWPAYANLTAGWFNYLAPYTSPSLLLFRLAELAGVSINNFLVFQKTLYYFILNLFAVVLLSKELIRAPIARWLPPLLFTLSAIPFAGFRDSVLWEAMPGPLFVLYGLVNFNNRRSESSLLMLIIFSVLMVASLNYAALQAAFWWLGFFLIFFAFLHPDLFRVTAGLIRSTWSDAAKKQVLVSLLLAAIAAAVAFCLPLYYNLGNLIRPNLWEPIMFDTGVGGGFQVGSNMLSHPIWTNFLYWAPNESIHQIFLRFDEKGAGPAGVDHRYIGLVTLPLLFVAVVRGHRNRTLLALLLAAAACLLFVTLTRQNLLIRSLIESFEIFKNIRTIADTLPRDGPAVLLILSAGIGLDYLVKSSESQGATSSGDSTNSADKLLKRFLFLLLVCVAVSIMLSFLPLGPLLDTKLLPSQRLVSVLSQPIFGKLKEAFAHIGVYLALYVFLCLLILRVRSHRELLAGCLLVLVFFDMTASVSSYWQRGLVWFKNDGPHTLPNPSAIGPVTSTLQTWPGPYGGVIHNSYSGPFIGLKPWFMMATRPQWQGLLENWDPKLRIMRAYPDFRFFSSAVYTPFDSITRIDSVALPPSGSFYVHSDAFRQLPQGEIKRLQPLWEVLEFSPNKLRMQIDMPEKGFMMSLDNYDPFWSATVDGRKVEIHRANFTFKAIEMNAGKHVVEWKYSPLPIKIAWAAFYLVIATIAIYMIFRLSWWKSASVGMAILLFLIGGMHLLRTDGKAEDSVGSHDLSATFPVGRMLGSSTVEPVTRLPLGQSGFQVQPGLGGSVEGASVDSYGMTTVQGWAIDQNSNLPALAVVIVVRDRLWLLGDPATGRTDIATGLGGGFWKSGFTVHGRGASADDLKTIRAFALLRDGTARELLYGPAVKRNANRN